MKRKIVLILGSQKRKSLRKDVTGSDIFLVLLKEISLERLSRTLPHTQICYVQIDDFVSKFANSGFDAEIFG